jgi:outer membrane protein assembly factor BamE
MRLPSSVLLGALVLALAGCESLRTTDSFLGIVTPYRIDIVQGNVVTKEQHAALKPGMTRNQVRDILGTPLLTDPFHADRWDYIFTIRRPGAELQRRSVVVRFENDRVKEIDAPDLPSERDFVASISKPHTARPPKLELSDEEKKALPAPRPGDTPATAPAAEPEGPAREYPPLEPTS